MQLKPPARARPALLFHRGERTALTAQAVDELFRTAEILTEGGLDAEARWYGSIMITFDLAELRRRSRGLEDEEDLAQLADLAEGSVRVRIRAHRMACGEVLQRFPDRWVGTAHIDCRFRREANLLLLDIDLEVPVGRASRRSAT